ncbi:hypothetical protein [Noviherbaspirillum aerium]|uniref:hypothetical protein n=1 Tax=Noviherbaspirillum aerium TaxID=2588497 RepID=UPI00124EA14B|nr:hypothetical protein [Noviherbaspirillum aerium]
MEPTHLQNGSRISRLPFYRLVVLTKARCVVLKRIADECAVASACFGRMAALFVAGVARHTALLPPCPAPKAGRFVHALTCNPLYVSVAMCKK